MDKLRNTIGLINFIVLLDNYGKRLYAKYFVLSDSSLNDVNAQKEFEKKIGQSVLNLNVNKSNESIFLFFLF